MTRPNDKVGGPLRLPGSAGKVPSRAKLLDGSFHCYFLPGSGIHSDGSYKPPNTNAPNLLPVAGAPLRLPRACAMNPFQIFEADGTNWEVVKLDLYAYLNTTYLGHNVYAGSFGGSGSGGKNVLPPSVLDISAADAASGQFLATDWYCIQFFDQFTTFGAQTELPSWTASVATARQLAPLFPRCGLRLYLYDSRAEELTRPHGPFDFLSPDNAAFVARAWANALAFFSAQAVADLGDLGYEWGGVIGKTVPLDDMIAAVETHWGLTPP